MSKQRTAKPKTESTLKLDLGCGQNRVPNFTGVDLYAPGVDVRLDLFKFPWPWKSEEVEEIHCSHFLEHVPQQIRWPFMAECWRILKPEGVMRIIVPSWKSERAYGDMSHVFPPVVAMFFWYLNKAWREANKLTYGPYDIKCNFEHQAGPTGIVNEFANRNHEAQVFACTYYLETYGDMWVTLTKKQM